MKKPWLYVLYLLGGPIKKVGSTRGTGGEENEEVVSRILNQNELGVIRGYFLLVTSDGHSLYTSKVEVSHPEVRYKITVDRLT